MPIDGQCGEWLVTFQHQFHRLAGRLQCRVIEFALGEDRREPRGDQQGIALPQRHLQQFGEPQQHFATRT
jgi:hypothetical protein